MFSPNSNNRGFNEIVRVLLNVHQTISLNFINSDFFQVHGLGNAFQHGLSLAKLLISSQIALGKIILGQDHLAFQKRTS